MVACFGLADGCLFLAARPCRTKPGRCRICNSGNLLHILPPNMDYKHDLAVLSSGAFVKPCRKRSTQQQVIITECLMPSLEQSPSMVKWDLMSHLALPCHEFGWSCQLSSQYASWIAKRIVRSPLCWQIRRGSSVAKSLCALCSLLPQAESTQSGRVTPHGCGWGSCHSFMNT
jgi:hypothetical protein